MHACFYNNNKNGIGDEAKTQAASRRVEEKKREGRTESTFITFFFSTLFFHPSARERGKKPEFLLALPVDMPCRYIQQKRRKKRTSLHGCIEEEKKREIENAGNLFHAPMDGMWFCMALLSFFFLLFPHFLK